MGRTSEAKEKLISAAFELIWDDSYHSIGVNEICKKAGVKPGSFYYFFPSKQGLALEAMEVHWKENKKALFSRILQDTETTGLEKIQRIFEEAGEYQASRVREGKAVSGCAFGSFIGELGEKDTEVRSCMEAILNEIGNCFRECVTIAVESGELKPASENEIRSMTQAVLAYFEGVAIMARARNSAAVFKELAPFVINLLIK